MDRQLQRRNVPVWFEIPATDLSRATRFYETLFAASLQPAEMGGQKLAIFPYRGDGGCTGAVVAAAGLKPNRDGVVVYLNADPALDEVLARVERAGGRICHPRTALPDGMGFFANIVDTEGNRVGLHAMT